MLNYDESLQPPTSGAIFYQAGHFGHLLWAPRPIGAGAVYVLKRDGLCVGLGSFDISLLFILPCIFVMAVRLTVEIRLR